MNTQKTRPASGLIQVPVVGVLLAGGLSRRMGGGDKGLRLLAGKPLLHHVAERLASQAKPIILNANGDPSRFSAFELPVVPDVSEGFAGPLAGVLAGLLWADRHAPHAPYIVTAACDTPFFPFELVQSFLHAAGGDKRAIVLAASNGQIHPVFGLWPVALAKDLLAALQAGTRKVLDFTQRHQTYIAAFPQIEIGAVKIDPFFNANTPSELAEAQRLLAPEAVS
jgi:molybdopterin-guanine dinucleotide biosynthesis protein A